MDAQCVEMLTKRRTRRGPIAFPIILAGEWAVDAQRIAPSATMLMAAIGVFHAKRKTSRKKNGELRSSPFLPCV